jgi:hypothetical protein
MVSHTPGAKRRMEERLKGHLDRNPEAALRSTPRLARNDRTTRAKKVVVLLPERREDYLIREDEALVYWEREVRRYVDKVVDPVHGDRIAAPMIYAWSMGQEIGAAPAEGGEGDLARLRGSGGVVNPELRRINKILRHYFGAPYRSFIQGRQYPNTYRVHKGYYIKYKPPMTLTLYAEYLLKVLVP